jgi:hypothetical protein
LSAREINVHEPTQSIILSSRRFTSTARNFDLNADPTLNQVALESEQQTSPDVSIPDSQLGDERTLGSLCAHPSVIGLCRPFILPFGSMSGSLHLMRLHPGASGSVTAGLVYGPPDDIDSLVNMEESIPSVAHLSMGLQPVREEFSIGRYHSRMRLRRHGKSEEEPGQADNEITAVNVDLDSINDNGTAPEKEKLPGEAGNPPDTLEELPRFGYAGMVFLSLDGFSGHVTDAIEEACVYYEIQMIAIPPHTSSQAQPLDLGLFALHKSESHRVQSLLDFSTQMTKLIRWVYGFRKAATPVSVIAAFRRDGIGSPWDQHAKVLRCFIDCSQAAEV